MINCSCMICTCRALACSLAFCSSFSFWVSWERNMAHASSLSKLHSNVEDKQQKSDACDCVMAMKRVQVWRGEDWRLNGCYRTAGNFHRYKFHENGVFTSEQFFPFIFPSLAWMQNLTLPCVKALGPALHVKKFEKHRRGYQLPSGMVFPAKNSSPAIFVGFHHYLMTKLICSVCLLLLHETDSLSVV